MAFCEPWIPPCLKLTLDTVVTRSAAAAKSLQSYQFKSFLKSCRWLVAGQESNPGLSDSEQTWALGHLQQGSPIGLVTILFHSFPELDVSS